MHPQLRNLSQLMKDKLVRNENFVVMLGAGASLSSGVKPTTQIMAELLDKYGQDLKHKSLEEGFDDLWRRSTENDRDTFLQPYLKVQKISPGYEALAKLIQRGYINLILTFNFDVLLETALDQLGFRDYKVIIRGETETNALQKLLEKDEPRVKIIKLHGSLRSSDYFLFSKDEMLNYPPEIHELVKKITGEDIIVCGYAFRDWCVIKAFNDNPDSGSIYYVNPTGANDSMKGLLYARRSNDKVISGDYGKFDDFFVAVNGLLEDGQKPQQQPENRMNPFKFLDFYHVKDKDWFLGRDKLRDEVLEFIRKKEKKVLHLCGPIKAGKSSFVRAGIVAHLDTQMYDPVLIRCHANVEKQLRQILQKRFQLSEDVKDWKKVLSQIENKTDKQVIIFFDQFERVVRKYIQEKKEAELLDLMNELFHNSGANFMFVFVTVPSSLFLIKIINELEDQYRELKYIDHLNAESVKSILIKLNKEGKLNLEQGIIDSLCQKYTKALTSTQEASGEGVEKLSFNLTHIQAICYYLAKNNIMGYDSYKKAVEDNFELFSALDAAINDCNISDLINDRTSTEERKLLRTILKTVFLNEPTKSRIAQYIRDHFPELIQEEVFPEPLLTT